MIDEEIWKRLEKLYLKLPETKDKNASDEDIREAETILDIQFSDFYRYFLKHHAVSSINEWVFYTLKKSEDSSSSNFSIVEVTKNFKKEASANALDFQGWYIISQNKNGEYIGINKKGEVWTLQQVLNFGKEKIAKDFEHFLTQLLN